MERLKIDRYVSDTQAQRLNYNIWITLEEILSELKNMRPALNQNSAESAGEFVCEKCGKSFDRKARLRGHQIKCKG